MSRVEIEAAVRVLANDTLQMVDQLRQREQGPDFIVYVGINEMNAIRYIGQPYYGRLHDESFCGCRLIGVKLDDYFHVAAK